MKQIIIWSENELERQITGEILSAGLEEVEILHAGSAEQALEILREGGVDLFVADIPQFNLAKSNVIASAQNLAPGTPILVISSGEQEHVSRNIWRLGVRDYLLKPCRPAWILAAAKALMGKIAASPQSETDYSRRKIYMNRLMEQLRGFQYKNCIQTTREYLDLLYRDGDNVEAIRNEVVDFAAGIAELGAPLGQTVQWKLNRCLEQFRVRFDRQGRKYESYLTLENMLDVMFEAMEESNFYEVEGGQKILNYIDRNVRKGLSLDKAAEYASMSSCYFSKFFKKMTGQNYIAYVTDGKIELAKQMLLDTEMPVINISYELSYGETNYFSKAFKRKVGVTPTEFRERNRRTRDQSSGC
ncbi:response regulator transcription factor [Pseudoflavonifractor phocaeensis]|uniref:response regulator transcription factor n=1 Tax=Pseudoflavonifractor phocaeensis TaxID=1870988 RepID=UPI0019579501|nr:helix-turn-helix domain-containing protein [Pseudoflavonifractor phocaeensis]MBM6926033.1 response regulator transcription factor [Pseudoflavonifractor phocaeensis]